MTSTASSGDSFPFDVVVITSPDEDAARAAEIGPLSSLELPERVKVLSTSDPFDIRCGSGGGTLAALDLVDETNSVVDSTVLIVHAGGQSSRCPTQMVLGKAWTSLPVLSTAQQRRQTSIIDNPTFLLIRSLAILLKNIPKGSVVVAASDVLLSLNHHNELLERLDWQNHYDKVIGLAVPAPLATAANHGVFKVSTLHGVNEPQIIPVETFLQKPALTKLQDNQSLHFLDQKEMPCAWIDTGVVMFLPEAAAAVRDLKRGTLKCCTRRGLMELYEERNCPFTPALDFYQGEAVKVELYSHLLMALTTTTTSDKSDYLSKHEDLPPCILEGIYEALSPHPLHALVMADGQFMHLGTTREMISFLTEGASWNDTRQQQHNGLSRCSDFGRELRLVRRTGNAIFGHGTRIDTSCVVINTMIECCGSTKCSVGQGTILEHSSLLCSNGTIKVGENCLLSGVRGEMHGSCMEIPSDMCLQVLSLDANQVVYMYFGVHDKIKSGSTLYCVPLPEVLQRTGISMSDIWAEESTTNDATLWNAKIHPVLKKSSNMELQSMFEWVGTLRGRKSNSGDEEDRTSLDRWKNATRLSFAEICEAADANAEFLYRSKLTTRIKERKEEHFQLIQQILMNRQHKPCNFNFLVNEYIANRQITQDFWQALKSMDEAIIEGIKQREYDVSSRAFLVMSGLFADLVAVHAEDLPPDDDEVVSDIAVLRCTSSSAEQLQQSCERVLSHRNDLLEGEGPSTSHHVVLRNCAPFLEGASFSLIQKCVSDRETLVRCRQRTRPVAPLDTWVVASAPVRIDLSGGWSDTPPVSYEHGGAVSCLAVTVDGRKPLSCRCRILSGRKGLTLCTESRNSSENLLSQTKVQISRVYELADYQNPRADCALIKCALILFGMVSADELQHCQEQDLQPFINVFCGSGNDVGMEIVSKSYLPHGSGMGTSSILGGCVLAAVGKCIGVDLVSEYSNDNDESLIQAVLTLEQLLSTGGGWQDQVGGLVGGLKLATSASTLPLRTKIQRIPIDPIVRAELDQRLILAYSGKTRIAKNILQNVLRRWAQRTSDMCKTVEALVAGAKSAADAVHDGDLDKLGECLNSYWQQKKTMAGNGSGVEPAVVREILAELLKRKEIIGGSLCGAGGGGFMVLLAAVGRSGAQIRQTVENELSEIVGDMITWHECRVSQEGLTVQVEAPSRQLI